MRSSKNKAIIVHAPNQQGESFINLMREKSLPLTGLANSPEQALRLETLGLDRILFIDPRDKGVLENTPGFQIGKAFLFVENVIESCMTTYILRRWTNAPIIVVSPSEKKAPASYKALGANIVLYSRGMDLGFLLSNLP